MLLKQKVHLMLHLVNCMEQFGPTSSFNSERYVNTDIWFAIVYYQHLRCETFNSFIRIQNIYGNKSAPSKDIAHHFAIIEHLRYICSGGYLKGQRYYDYMLLIILLRILVDRCGEDLKILFSNPDIQHFLNSIPMCDLKSDKAIYQPGTLRKVSAPCINSASVCMHSNSLRHWRILVYDSLLYNWSYLMLQVQQ